MSDAEPERGCQLCDNGFYGSEDELVAHIYEQHTRAEFEEAYANEDLHSELYEALSEKGWAFDDGSREQSDEASPGDDAEAEPDATRNAAAREDAGTGRETPSDTLFSKWYILGVGGCGSNLLDSLLLRRAHLESRDDRQQHIWDAAINGYNGEGCGMINTNQQELSNTFYARELKGNPSRVAGTNTINSEDSKRGAGRDREVALEYIEKDFNGVSDGVNPFKTLYGSDINLYDIQNAQAVLLLHSLVKGTGTGATPYLAKRLREDVVSSGQPILSGVVLPDEKHIDENSGLLAPKNAAIGITEIAKATDAIIPFDNTQLESANARADIKDDIPAKECHAMNYQRQNQAFVSFIEAFSMSSIPTKYRSLVGISGAEFDIPDSFRPPRSLAEGEPPIVLAPAMDQLVARIRPGEFDEELLIGLLDSLMASGRLADFDPSTAWGGTFLFICPPDIKDEVKTVVEDSTDPFTRPEVLDAQGDSQEVEVITEFLGVESVDKLQLWATFWNPKMDTLEEMFERAEGLIHGDRHREVEEFRSLLGRERLAREVSR